VRQYIPHILYYDSKLRQSCPLDFEIFDRRLTFKANSSNPKSYFLYLQYEGKLHSWVTKREKQYNNKQTESK